MTKPDTKFLVQIDSKAFTQKPESNDIGGIKTRTQNSQAKYLTTKELATGIEQGKSFSLGILDGGLGASNWKEQQIFGVDIDNNEKNLPILTPKEAIQICKDNEILPMLCYKTFSNSEEKPKYRLLFKLNESVKDENKRLLIASTLVALFPQADKSCVNADRIFFGTNKKVKILDKIVSFDKILELSEKTIVPVKEKLTELDKLKADFDFESLLNEECGEMTRKTKTYIMYKNCPICGHCDDFIYYTKTKTFKCFGAHGGAGGSIIDYLMATRNLSQKQAIDYFKLELCKLPRGKNADQRENQQLELISAKQLITQKLAPINWCMENFLPQGLALVVAQPKSGKSWLTLAICLSVATGIDFLGYRTNKGESLYLALEDSRHRLKNRLEKILDENEIPENFNFAIKAPSLANGLIDMLEKYMQEHPNTKLIAIDTLQKIRTGASRQEGAYAADYREVGILKSFADKYNITVLLVHHLRKQKDADVFNKISGTNGIMGVADTIFILDKDCRESNEAKLHITGRDVEFDELYLSFNKSTCQWTSDGNAEIQTKKREVKEYNNDPIIKALRKLIEIDADWRGTAQELLNAFIEKCNISLDEKPESIGRKLRKYTDLMQEVDSIIYTPPSANGSNGRRVHKFHLGVKFAEDYSLWA